MKKWSIVLILAVAQFIMVLDSTVMNVSITSVVADLHTTVSALQAAITFYTLTMAAFMLTGGKLGDIWGRRRAFRIGAIIYAVGSLITAFSPNIQTMFVGWSVIEGLGAVLVIPAIAALIAMNYSGRDRVKAFTIIGAAGGVAVAAGPLIGGYLTTYLSWRYVFVAETVIMAVLIMFSGTLKEPSMAKKVRRLDSWSVVLSALGMSTLVLGILQSKVWGWVTPKVVPQIAGHPIAPLGISLVTYLIILGLVILWAFVTRQRALENNKGTPLLKVSMLNILPLRGGLAVLTAQYLIIAATFFILPIFLQLVLGLDALQTGIRMIPLSISIIIFSVIGARMVRRYTPRRIVRIGQLSLLVGTIILLGSIGPQMSGWLLASGLFVLGIGLGLLASQIGNVTMSAVNEGDSSEVGGLQGTFQNLGSSFGTALIGSVMIASLTSGFVTSVNSSNSLTPQVKASVNEAASKGVPIASASDIEQLALTGGATQSQATDLSTSYATSQIASLKASLVFLAVIALLSIALSRNIPNKLIAP
jgi:EmrB/QacA subfamily drug resistance transporter